MKINNSMMHNFGGFALDINKICNNTKDPSIFQEEAYQFLFGRRRIDAFHPRILCPGGKPQHFGKCEMGRQKKISVRGDRRSQQAHPRLNHDIIYN